LTEDRTPTGAKLAIALEAEGAPAGMAQAAREGFYDDYRSPLPFPQSQLLADARALGLTEIVRGVLAGDFDAQPWEADAWAASADGEEALALLFSGQE
jgi:hypothetical protein